MEEKSTLVTVEKNEEVLLYKELLAQAQKTIEQFQETTGQKLPKEVVVPYDPWDIHNPYDIIGEIPPDANFPNGQVVAWKNPTMRNDSSIGWRGWRPFKYGDEYTGPEGEKLADYIPDPPVRMEGRQHMDSYVRRGDIILCRLDKVLHDTRRTLRELRSDAARGRVVLTYARPGTAVIGEGITNSERPAGGFSTGEGDKEPVSPNTLHTQKIDLGDQPKEVGDS